MIAIQPPTQTFRTALSRWAIISGFAWTGLFCGEFIPEVLHIGLTSTAAQVWYLSVVIGFLAGTIFAIRGQHMRIVRRISVIQLIVAASLELLIGFRCLYVIYVDRDADSFEIYFWKSLLRWYSLALLSILGIAMLVIGLHFALKRYGLPIGRIGGQSGDAPKAK